MAVPRELRPVRCFPADRRMESARLRGTRCGTRRRRGLSAAMRRRLTLPIQFLPLLRATEQRLFRVLRGHGHLRVEELRLRAAVAHGTNVTEVPAGIGL